MINMQCLKMQNTLLALHVGSLPPPVSNLTGIIFRPPVSSRFDHLTRPERLIRGIQSATLIGTGHSKRNSGPRFQHIDDLTLNFLYVLQ